MSRWKPPKRVTTRRKQLERHGARCFLVPSKKAPKYPVCNQAGQVTCQGLHAAFLRAQTQSAAGVKSKALRRAKSKGCPWAKGGLSGLGDTGLLEDWAVSDGGHMNYKPGAPMGVRRSVLFTSPSKVKTMTWSVPAVLTCPAVCRPISAELRRSAESGGQFDMDKVISQIPKKCLGCYAFQSGKYGGGNVVAAQMRRWAWFEQTPDDIVVDTLAVAIRDGKRTTCNYKPVTKDSPWECDCKQTAAGHKKCDCERHAKAECKGTQGNIQSGKRIMPDRVRLFDSGDFSDERAVRIWGKVIARLRDEADAERIPRIKWWIPTTAYAKAPEIRRELIELKKIDPRNIAIRPSAYQMDLAAPHVPGLDAGTTVVGWESTKATCPAHIENLKRSQGILKPGQKCVMGARQLHDDNKTVYFSNDSASKPDFIKIKGKEHFLCTGDCATCPRKPGAVKGACWDPRVPVAYIQHGPNVEEVAAQRKRMLGMRQMVMLALPQFYDRGPEGVTEDRLSPMEVIKSKQYEQKVLDYHLQQKGPGKEELDAWRRRLADLRRSR